MKCRYSLRKTMPSGCWQQTCTPIDTCEEKKSIVPVVLFSLVTTSLCQDQVICASIAFRRISHNRKTVHTKKFRLGQKLQPFKLLKNNSTGTRNCNCISQLTPSKKDCISFRWKCKSLLVEVLVPPPEMSLKTVQQKTLVAKVKTIGEPTPKM